MGQLIEKRRLILISGSGVKYYLLNAHLNDVSTRSCEYTDKGVCYFVSFYGLKTKTQLTSGSVATIITTQF